VLPDEPGGYTGFQGLFGHRYVAPQLGAGTLQAAGPNSGQVVVPTSGTTGTWADETDIRPTLLYLTGLKDDYEHDGRVITQVLAGPNHALSGPGVASLGACYKQLNSSVGQFGYYTLKAATTAAESSTPRATASSRV
jgi:hypothetical protein